MSIENVDARSWVGHVLHDAKNHKLGTIETIFFHDETGAPVWAAVSGGMFSNSKPFVPVDGVRMTPGGDLVVPYLKDAVKEAPEVIANGGHLTPEDITTLQGHYHERFEPTASDTVEPRNLEQPFRGSSNESTFGTGQTGPGEPDDMSQAGTGHSDSETWRTGENSAPLGQDNRG